MTKIKNAMTVDVEEYFQVSAFEPHIRKEDWGNMQSGVESNIDRILSIFNDRSITATFFILGWIAERHGSMIERIASEGHEIASHGFSHVRIHQQNSEEFKEDVTKTKKILEDIVGQEVIGYRAASFSINQQSHWAHKELEEAGFRYSSSVYPVKHDLYGVPDAPRYPYQPNGTAFLEIPITTLSLGRLNIPCGGGGYFRLFPYTLSRKLIAYLNKNEKMSCIFYFHPWEIEVDQPRIDNLRLKTRFRHYNGLKRMESRLQQLTGDFIWGRMDKVFL